MKNSLILLVAVSLAGAVGGFIVGKNSSPALAGSGGEERVAIRTKAGERSEELVGDGAHPRPAAKGIDKIAKLPGRSNQIQALVEFYAGLNVEQLKEEAGKIANLPWDEHDMARSLLFARWAEVDAYSAIEHAKGMRGFDEKSVMSTILHSWASVEPVNAARYYEKNVKSGGIIRDDGGIIDTENVGSVIASQWAKQDPQAALTWANSLRGEKRQALVSVVREVAKTDPAKAVQMLSGVNAEATPDTYRTVAETYGSKNFAEAQSWVQSLPADQQADVMASAITGLAKTDPNAAAAQVATMAAGDSKAYAVAYVAGSMARENPQAAAEFMMQNKSANTEWRGMNIVLRALVAKDPAAALNFVNNIPEGEARDDGLGDYVKCNSSAPLSELVQVAESMSKERRRSFMVESIVERWLLEDQAAAKAYIQDSTSVSDEMKERLLGEK